MALKFTKFPSLVSFASQSYFRFQTIEWCCWLGKISEMCTNQTLCQSHKFPGESKHYRRKKSYINHRINLMCFVQIFTDHEIIPLTSNTWWIKICTHKHDSLNETHATEKWNMIDTKLIKIIKWIWCRCTIIQIRKYMLFVEPQFAWHVTKTDCVCMS